jgi:hypothetical protein
MRIAALVAAGWLLVAGCGSAARAAVSHPPPTARVTTPAASPSFVADQSEQLVLTGAIQLRLDQSTVGTPCGQVPAGYFVTFRFDVGGQPYAADVMIADYNGPGSYPAPPARISVHTLGLIANPILYASTAGHIRVDPGDRSGSFDADLAAQSSTAHVSGAWRCP